MWLESLLGRRPWGGDPARITSHISLAATLLTSQRNWRKCPVTSMTQTQISGRTKCNLQLKRTGYNELEPLYAVYVYI